MSRYTGPKNRLSRREGFDLFGKGNKLKKATQPPGQHGLKNVRRSSGFSQQLREKQKTKRIYGTIESQFRGYFKKARAIKGNTGATMLRLLETRLDNIVYRLGFAPSRMMARQLVSHRHVLVNGQLVNLPSCRILPGQTISLTDKALSIPHLKALMDTPEFHVPDWLDRKGPVGTVKRLPDRSDIDIPVNEQLIVEFYSR